MPRKFKLPLRRKDVNYPDPKAIYRMSIEMLEKNCEDRRQRRLTQHIIYGLDFKDVVDDYDKHPANPDNAPTQKQIKEVKKNKVETRQSP